MSYLRKDPRFGLDFVEISSLPLWARKPFAHLKNAAVYWIGGVEKYSSDWKQQTRVFFVTDQCIYTSLKNDGSVCRCIEISSLEALVLSSTIIGFKTAKSSGEYDLCIENYDANETRLILEVVSKIHDADCNEPIQVIDLNVNPGAGTLKELMKLNKPEGYQSKPLIPVRTREQVGRMYTGDEERGENILNGKQGGCTIC